MASFFFSVYDDAKEVALGYPGQSGSVAVGPTWTQSTEVAGYGVKRVRVMADASCIIERGGDPDGNGVTERLPANSVEYFWIRSGDRIAVKEA